MNTTATTTDFETGAKTWEINELILFVETTRNLVIARDNIFADWFKYGNFGTAPFYEKFNTLYLSAKNAYCKEFKNNCQHIKHLSNSQIIDFCQYFVDFYPVWKNELKFN